MGRVGLRIRRNEAKGVEVPFNRDELKKIFKRHDVNGDGKLSWDETKAAFEELKALWPAFNTVRGFRLADNNQDHFINTQDQEVHHLVDYALTCGFTHK